MNIASLFNLAGPDLIVILVIVLLLFGAKKLPELARGMGQAMREFTKAKDEFEREVTRPPQTEVVQKLDEPKVEPAHDTQPHDAGVHATAHEEPQPRVVS
jgi:sec-independent protein translocase protein TatA